MNKDCGDLGAARPGPAVITTRGSALALWQARHVADLLASRQVTSSLHIVKTTADRIQDRFLHELGGKGLFIKELEEALLAGAADLAIHSLKDLPVSLAAAFKLAAILPRHAATDVLILNPRIAARFPGLPPVLTAADVAGLGTLRIGTGSLRRQALLKRHAPLLTCVGIRGNVDTRLAKLAAGDWDGIVLAEASLDRLGISGVARHRLAPDWFVPSPSQGALGLETLAENPLAEWLKTNFACALTTACVACERLVLEHLGGDCTLPFGCHTTVDAGSTLVARAILATRDGDLIQVEHRQPWRGLDAFEPSAVAAILVGHLKARGAAGILAKLGLALPPALLQ